MTSPKQEVSLCVFQTPRPMDLASFLWFSNSSQTGLASSRIPEWALGALSFQQNTSPKWGPEEGPLDERGCPRKWLIAYRDGLFTNVIFILGHRELLALSSTVTPTAWGTHDSNCGVSNDQGKRNSIPPSGSSDGSGDPLSPVALDEEAASPACSSDVTQGRVSWPSRKSPPAAPTDGKVHSRLNVLFKKRK